ncbi:MAG: hypothetical protein F2735_01455 [Actinobacteria bacterium]|uniref:Unannotated protein n=1 Tax=freshwater metagenome TaxID=449393 RepID=A0A6J6X1S0_9ZZZZ|nr:hypothetical protein [Actinomycetota bacterium]
MSGERTLPWTHQSRALAGYRLRYGDHPVGDGEYVYRYDGTETVQTSVPSARWHPGDTFRVLDRIDHPDWIRVDEDGNAIDNGIASVATLPDDHTSGPATALLGEDAGAHDLSTPETPVAPPVAVPAALAPAKAPVKAAVKAPVKAPVIAVAVPVEAPAKEPATAPAEAPGKTAPRP